jgi:hypothetical protein
MEQSDVLQLEHERVGSKVKVTARRRGEVVHMHVIDLANAHQRKRFIKELVERLPQADAKALDAELLRIADTAKNNPAPADQLELDVSRIVRPELFFAADVSGLAVPVVQLHDGKPAARWHLYLRWADGRRESRELTNHIDLADGRRLWIYPVPGEPTMNTNGLAGWSAPSRRAWLNGAAAPDPADLFKRVCERIAHFIDLSPDTAAGTTATLALWSMLTYCYQAWDAVPYLFVGGPMSSGKSTLFGILNRLVYRPLASSNLTAAALFRTLHDRGGTLLFDEAERLRQSTPDVQETLSMLLAGYRRGGQAMRLEAVGDSFRSVTFDVYGPKALACIAGLPPALASRCIPVIMFRAGPDSPKPKRRIDADPAGWQSLQDDLHVLALEHGPAWLDLSRRSAVCPTGINGRSFELWQPLLALAEWIESHGAVGLLQLVQRHALNSIDAGKEDQIPDADETLLEILTDAIRAGRSPTPGEILITAKDRDLTTFGKWGPRTVSNRLANYGIKTDKGRQRRYQSVTLADLRRIQAHYGLDLGIEPTDPGVASPASPAPPGGKNSRTADVF